MCRGLESVPLRSDEVVLRQLLVQAQVLKPPRQLCLLEELGFAPGAASAAWEVAARALE